MAEIKAPGLAQKARNKLAEGELIPSPVLETHHSNYNVPGKCLVPKAGLQCYIRGLSPFRTAVPFWGQTTQIPSSISSKRDCGPKRVKGGVLVVGTNHLKLESALQQGGHVRFSFSSKNGSRRKLYYWAYIWLGIHMACSLAQGGTRAVVNRCATAVVNHCWRLTLLGSSKREKLTIKKVAVSATIVTTV